MKDAYSPKGSKEENPSKGYPKGCESQKGCEESAKTQEDQI